MQISKIILFISIQLLFACNLQNPKNKFVGTWVNSGNQKNIDCSIRENASNFILEFVWDYKNDKLQEIIPGYYDKNKNRILFSYTPRMLTIDALNLDYDLKTTELSIVYDKKFDQLIFERVGIFKRK